MGSPRHISDASPDEKPAWYALDSEDCLNRLTVSSDQGLNAEEAASRLHHYGRNILQEEKEKSAWVKFLEQYKSYMQIVLIIAAGTSLYIQLFKIS